MPEISRCGFRPTDAEWAWLKQMNATVNADETYQAGTLIVPLPDGQKTVGDCKSCAFEKFNRCAAHGLPTDCLAIFECLVTGSPTQPGYDRNHMVLGVNTDEGWYILTNGFDDILPIVCLDWKNWYRLDPPSGVLTGFTPVAA